MRSLSVVARLLGLAVTSILAGLLSPALSFDSSMLCSNNPACGDCDGLRLFLAISLASQLLLAVFAAVLLIPPVSRRWPGQSLLVAGVSVPAVAILLFLVARAATDTIFCTPAP